MHNLAIALHHKGYQVTGSDDEIFEPSRSRLATRGLLPLSEGWDASRITTDLDAVILGMHAKKDNPELLRATELGIPIFSYPEYLYEQSKDKKRVVIGGSHGKTSITAMILHVLQHAGVDADYMVGAQLDGFEVMVKLSENAKIMVIEGDEYLTSPIDLRPKFHLYKPDIALLSGIAWDHINVFPTFDNYIEQFKIFIGMVSPGGALIYSSDDPELERICRGVRDDISIFPYPAAPAEINDGTTFLIYNGNRIPLQIFGRHNLMNLNGARIVCNQLGISDATFFDAIRTFRGASKRLELIGSAGRRLVYKDFAHAPSKVKATLAAVKEQYPDRRVIACLELHTYSSLKKEFLSHYLGTLDPADLAVVYFSPHALQLKRLPEISEADVREGFGTKGMEVFTDPAALKARLSDEKKADAVLLMMSSGNYDGIDLKEFGTAWVQALPA